jgi:hypothetical protein
VDGLQNSKTGSHWESESQYPGAGLHAWEVSHTCHPWQFAFVLHCPAL